MIPRLGLRTLARAALICLGASALTDALAAQASPYLSLDDPSLPLLEHLIARGEVEDPTPMVRPFRRRDAVRVLRIADSVAGGAGAGAVGELLRRWTDRDESRWWRGELRAGGQAYSAARRDPLHADGPSDAAVYAEARVDVAVGPIMLVSRLVDEPRIRQDPDWTGALRNMPNVLCCGWRYPDAYVSAQSDWGSVFYGQVSRNWGPRGVPGIGVSDVSYARPEVAFEVRTRDLHLLTTAAQLEDARDTAGTIVHRYFFTHRLGLRLGNRLQIAGWETTVIAGPDREFDGRYRNPLTLSILGNLYGFDDRGNTLVGVDVRWRPADRLTLEAQLALDDLASRESDEGHPSRYAFTLAAGGPLGGRAAWKALYTQATSLAFRTFNPFENLSDAGVGLGRNFADNDQVTATVGVPLRGRWLITPELTLLRQGEGRITTPYPPTRPDRAATPTLFIGTVEKTWRAAVGVSGQEGGLAIRADAGFHHVVNAGHVAGVTDDRFEGRVTATIGLFRSGTLR
jgi:hypothetical protein